MKTVGVGRLFALASVGTALVCAAAHAEDMQVVRYGESVYVRSRFSDRDDLVVRVGKGSNRQVNFAGARLIAKGSAMAEKELNGGRLIHGCGDDSTPWNINGTYIGANHGCSDLREVISPGHQRTTADLGSRWDDAAGKPFYLIKIVDRDRLWFLPENTGQGAVWQFRTKMTGTRLTCVGRGATLELSKVGMAQLRPACRIRRQEYLVDGTTPLADAAPVACARLDIVEEYDIINPASVLRDAVEHPGTQRDFAAEHLEGVIANRITYRFDPNGATVIEHTARALQEFAIGYMGFIQSARLAKGDYDTHEYYIPKTRPFTQDNISYNFRALQDYTARPPSSLRFSEAAKNIEDPANLPERFIQFLGRKQGGQTVREVGYALGYSLIHGLTRPAVRSQNASTAINLYITSKSYPTAVDSKRGPTVAAGTQFECTAYRQYFCPREPATCFYWHEEAGETVVYADYHRPVERDVLRLPAALAGKTMAVVEKTPSLTLHGEGTVPPEGVTVSVDGNYGYVVLRIK